MRTTRRRRCAKGEQQGGVGVISIHIDQTQCALLGIVKGEAALLEGFFRIVKYPEEALREALLNAVVHRDYDYSGSIIINIYDDRMEFISLGGLVKGLTLLDIKGGVSQPRNAVGGTAQQPLHILAGHGALLFHQPDHLLLPAQIVVGNLACRVVSVGARS